MATIISADHLTKSYGRVKAVDEINLRVEEGDFYAFLGPNGAGKTTTIRLITGIIQPDKGNVAVAGHNPHHDPEAAKIIGVIPESRGFYDWMTAKEYLAFFAELYQVPFVKRISRITKLLRQVDLADRSTTPIGTYSRGMRQRLGLARALINEPRILLLDEPTLGLDPQGQADIQQLLKELNQSGVTIFLSSHLLPEVASLCTRLAILNEGRLVAEGTLDELREQANLDKAYRLRVISTIEQLEKLRKHPFIKDPDARGQSVAFTFEGDLRELNCLIDDMRREKIALEELQAQNDNLTNIFLRLTKEDKQHVAKHLA